MTRIRMSPRLAAIVLIAAGLSACGFHLRNRIALPPDLGPVKVVSTATYSPLAESVSRGLQAAGATLAPEGAEDVAALNILSERWGDRPIAIDELGRAQEYSLRYAAVFEFVRGDGSELVPQQVVELSRDYVTPPIDATGTDTEREVLANELRKEMAASILRRVDSVIQNGAAGAHDAGTVPLQSADPDDAPPSDTLPAVPPIDQP
ncbi:MAG: LPS assembly lipoprotein LptE [Pseudoxanthomonas sp.]